MPAQTRKCGRRSVKALYPCIKCNMEVSSRHQALECDGCKKWQHRKCTSGITQALYREVVQNENPFPWKCTVCVVAMPLSVVTSLWDLTSSGSLVYLPIAERARAGVVTQSSTLALTTDEPMEVDPAPSPQQRGGQVQVADYQAVEEEAMDNAAEEGDAASSPQRQAIEEDSMEDAAVDGDVEADDTAGTEYMVVEASTQRGHPKLVNSLGYSYVWRKQCAGTIHWRCSVRNRQLRCGATVLQRAADCFEPGKMPHNHPGRPGDEVVLQVIKEIKERATANVFASAGAIVEDVVVKAVHPEQPLPSLPKMPNLVRTANRVRQAQRPNHPQDLDFDLVEEFIPDDFLLKDSNGRRHLLFARGEQLHLLGRSKRWYIDGTFKLVKSLFYQLVSVHCFIKKDDAVKQVPLCFALMSGKKTSDYKAVFKALKSALPEANVQEVMMDFEAGLWKAMEAVFPNVKRLGCGFHWKQAVWRHIQSVGLQRAYVEKAGTYQLLKELMALPFLPADSISRMFEFLRGRATTPMLRELFKYVEQTWLTGTWKPKNWTVYMQSVRTNNDLEGWHNRINRRAGGRINLNMYELVEVLHDEAKMVSLQVRLVSEQKLTKRQRRRDTNNQGKLFKLWDSFAAGSVDNQKLLRGCAAIFGNAPDGY